MNNCENVAFCIFRNIQAIILKLNLHARIGKSFQGFSNISCSNNDGIKFIFCMACDGGLICQLERAGKEVLVACNV